MRRHTAVVRVVALLALLTGTFSRSVVASVAASDCNMPCCSQEQAQRMEETRCESGCGEKAEKAPVVIAEPEAEGCDCSIRSLPEQLQVPIASAPTTGFHVPVIDAVLPATQKEVCIQRFSDSGNIVFRSDSGPPIFRPQYASLGRAPPVPLA